VKDELWMQTWNDGHPHFSADLHRGLLWLLTALRRLAGSITPARHPAEHNAFAPIARDARHKPE